MTLESGTDPEKKCHAGKGSGTPKSRVVQMHDLDAIPPARRRGGFTSPCWEVGGRRRSSVLFIAYTYVLVLVLVLVLVHYAHVQRSKKLRLRKHVGIWNNIRLTI
ncbi:hypothetical protein BO99DRAFT_405884 [Aspergillus violaceofuscus CBS 115571]|uniref:Uncharacterized protein n=1 Tax=Aspergillus violaceofuscus (strain CBS 115571) TaxID=1450538 RepID=A0A2V5H0V3_ASPV1|nr:hypothetical protein BO99DRAFT_405884 [Aspergillus violaceofuscus CBS 115571]